MRFTFFDQYAPMGDILVVATCIVFFILMHISYISRTKNLGLFRHILELLLIASCAHIIFYVMMLAPEQYPHALIYLMRAVYKLSLLGNLYLYVIYIRELLHMDKASARFYVYIGLIVFLATAVYEVIAPYVHMGFYLTGDNEPIRATNIFPFVYLFFIALLVAMIFFNNGRVYRQIVHGVGGTVAVALVILLFEVICHQTSYISATLLLPAFAVLYLLHSNPYNLETGSVNADAFENTIAFCHEQRRELYLSYLSVPDFEAASESYTDEIKSVIREFVSNFFHKPVLFSLSNGQFMLVIETAKNPDYKEIGQKMLDFFYQEYPKHQKDYKIIFTKTNDEISATNDYIPLIHYVADRMEDNSVHEVNDEDIIAFRKHEYILSELADIAAKQDLSDERVLVYCQPVYNILTEKYDTAEALMRLRLEETGMVFPDQFIPLAEKYNYIRTLSMIILSKTCEQVKKLLDTGYEVTRVSINFSAIDIRDVNFCQNVNRIIASHDIPYDKIAIEITESQSEKDFLVMKEKVLELQNTGIKFYLDDFGTGYSNYERILELPFDIIKFDRSLTIASGADLKSETMVSYLAHLFSDMGYSVLYEGIEDDNDEERCVRMCAKYLQGFKYSRPIPIEQLTDFFEQKQAASA